MLKIIKKLHFVFMMYCFVLVIPCAAGAYVAENDFKIISAKINDKNTFNINYVRLNDLIRQVNEKVQQQAHSYKNTNYLQSIKDVSEAQAALAKAKSAYSAADIKGANHYIKITLTNLKNAQLNLMPSRVVEARGLYLDADSIPTTKKEITKLIKEIKNANFNIIYPEVFRRGYSIIPNPVAEVDKPFKNVDFDLLEYIISEAHLRGIEVHPWVWVFRVKSPLYGDSFLKKYPFLIAHRDKPAFEDREPLFLSPASPMAKALVVKQLKFITAKYAIDGVLLDYIRYDETLGDDILTKQYFQAYFMDKYKVKPPEKIGSGDPLFTEWQLWREDQITQTVKMIKQELTSIRPAIKIGAAIFRTEKEGRLLKMQDWRLWRNNQLIKYVCPMLYTDNTTELNTWINSETDKETRNDYLYPSLGAHRFYSNDDIYPLVGLLNQRNIPGLNIFSIIHFGRENLTELAKGVFRKPAYIPHHGTFPAIKLILADTSGWLKKLSRTEKALPGKDLTKIAYQFDILGKTLPDNNYYPQYQKLKPKLDKLNFMVQGYTKTGELSVLFVQEIKHPVDYCLKLLTIYTREQTTKGKIFTSTLPPKR